MGLRYVVTLDPTEHEQLLSITSKGKAGARKCRRANILLMAHNGHSDSDIAQLLSAGTATVYRTKKTFVEEGLEAALNERGRAGRPRKLDGKHEALLVATACSKPPEGQSRWTLQLLADRLVVSTDLAEVSAQTVMRRLRDNELKPWQKKMWCIPKFDASFVARMEHVLDLYAQPHDPKRPIVNFDEGMKQLVEAKRESIPCKPGSPEKYDYEYRRTGTANIFLFFDRHRGWRHAKATQRKTAQDFAECMRELVDVHYRDTEVVRVVLDNLSTHSASSLYATYPPDEAQRIAKRLEFHYTPAHASWLNMVEIEIGIMNRQCLDRRISQIGHLKTELAAWQERRNRERATINWMFDVDRARTRLARAYPETIKTSGMAN